jgi:HK97 family phage major capsid protein
MSDIAALTKAIEDLGGAFDEYKKHMDAKLVEVGKKGEVSAEWKEKFTKLDDALHKADEAKQAAERLIAAASAPGGGGPGAIDPKLEEYQSAISEYMRKGTPESERKITELRKEVKTLSSLSDPDGGYYITVTESPEFWKVITETSPMRQIASSQTIGTASLKGRRRTARASLGGWVGEPDTRSDDTGTPQVGEWEIVAREQYAEPDAPQTLLDDAVVNVESWLGGEIQEEFVVAENTAFVLGNGIKRPRGFLTLASGTDYANGQMERRTGAGAAGTFSETDLFNLQGDLKEPYQLNASWTMNRAIMTEIRGFTAGTAGGPLWQPGLQAGVPALLLGRPYTLFQDMSATSAATDLIIAYGDFKKGYKIVDRKGTTILRDPFTKKGYVRFYTTRRVGGDVVNSEAIKILVVPS